MSSSTLTTRVTVRPEDTLIVVAGEVDLATVLTLESALSSLSDAEATNVVLDLADVTFMDSTGVAALIRARDRSILADGRLSLARPHEVVVRTLAICGLTELFDIV